MRRQILVLAAVLAFLWPACTQAAIVYEVIDLGTLGGDSSWASSINDIGQIVGRSDNSEYNCHATLFDATGMGNNIDLGTLGGLFNSYSAATSINNVGQIVGVDYPYSIYLRMGNAILFDPNRTGNNIDLVKLFGRM